MKKLKNLNKNSGGKVSMKLKSALLLLLVAIFSISGIMTVNAATVKDDGKYTLLLTCGLNGMDGKVDGDYAKIIKFDVADGDTTVSLSELTAGVLPFNGSTKFAYWATDWTGETKVAEDIPLSDFNSEGTFWANDGEVAYTNGLTIYATFSEEVLKGTGTYYLTLDGVGGKVNGKYEMTLTSSSSAYQTVDLTKYTPVRDGYTFVGWALNGEFVTEISADCFKESDAVKVLATYTKNTFDNDGIVVTLNANGGQLNGKESNTYDYVGGRDSGALMSLLPYVPVREGYTFNGWNTKSDGSGTMETYIYWRIWDNNEETNKKYDKDTLITEESGYERYKNVTLYASWTKNNSTPTKPENPNPTTPITPPASETVNKLESTGEINAVIEFPDGINKDYKLDIREVEVKKELADKNIRFITDINVLDGNNNVVKISDTKMKIRIALPEDLKGYDKYEVVYIVNDEIKETLPAAVENGYIVFETNHLSQYGIIATNTGNGTTSPKTGDTTSPKTGDTTSPKTGDNSNIVLWAALLFVSGGALAGTLVIDKKKKTMK
ncbi:InlB B-repeat-containing protein [Ruminococcus sp.]